ncbi:YlaI family protein [Bacillus mojavensis]|uniref:YlaI family protein n=1 Tax=Bacillus mojavensis TaxID=72360 RepID=UPI002DB6657C|nr:YlaI family protein [Bacillus mojavensis]MEC1290022.1 YlaI family protein [Bacillus mojavensis]MEC1622552.1 YlaI family protein [Bacillus mojavensis]MEC1660110.1 YlaI family protein [Bacillus mojavensis]MEC1683093.1 YlaI family protein [Bacillus mojavensis]MEC1705295.1 YlaI family protein [Bacillus mojavensis]
MMRVQCSICDKIETIDDETLIAKRLRNRPIHTYMCQECHDRIAHKTEERLRTGKFTLHPGQQKKEKVKK